VGRRVAALLLGVALALAGVEATVRALAPQEAAPPPGSLLRGPLTRPGDHRVRTEAGEVTVHVNAQGFVDDEWPALDAPRGAPRVVVLGDSFVQAAQVALEDGFGRRVQALLRAGGAPTAEVLSFGVPGAGTATALEVYRAHARGYRPDVVLLGFLVANDVLNNHPLLEGKDDKPFYALAADGSLVRTGAARASAPGALWEASHAWRWLTRERVAAAVARRKLALGRGMPVDLRVHDPAPDAVWEDAWAVTDALVGTLAREVRADGGHFVTVLFPDGVAANARDRAAAVERFPAATGWDLGRAHARAAALASRHGDTLDLLPVLRDRPELYLPKDGHWTAAGHAVAAAAVADGLTAP
jgi:hypothetical protein